MTRTRKKSLAGRAVLAAGALVASVLVAGVAPAAAVTDRADHATRLSACVGDAAADRMFTDVSAGHVFRAAINCVAYYGITRGTGDGSTYSPEQVVTRAQMAVFIARAAEVAGVDLGSAGDAGFDDIDDAWAEAQAAINRLALKGIIPSGGAFRPGDAITRAEMATFLIGLLVEAAPDVTRDSSGAILLGVAGSRSVADDRFPDAVGAEIAAIYELGVTRGASAADVQDDTEPPLDFNYEPDSTVDRGQMAAFITRALAHTSARPEGVTAQYDWIASNVVVSMRDGDFAPVAGEVVDVIRIPTTSEDAAFKGNGECSVDVDIVMIGTGEHGCEIDGADPITGGDGDARVAFDGVDDGGTTVWAWTGEEGDELDDDTTLYRLEITTDPPRPASRVRITSSHPGIKKVHLGSSVVYTVQLQDHLGDVTIGPDATDPRPSRFFVTLSTYAIVPSGATFDDTQPVSPTNNLLARNAQGASVRTTIPLITDDDGKATFTVSGLPDSNPLIDRDEYVVEIHIQGQPGPAGNAPPIAAYYLGSSDMAATPSATGLVAVREGASAADYWGGLVFSTEPNDSSRLPVTDGDGTVVPGISVSVSAAAKYIASNGRGASTRATVTASDQYNDPIAGAAVSLGTNATDDGEMVPIVIASGRAIATGRDGSYTFGYTRENAASFVETLTGSWNHDGDDGTTPAVMGTATVRWAALADDAETVGQQIRSFDTDTNTIYAGLDDATNGVIVFYYDENDRYNIISGGATSTTTYAGFERNLSTYTGYLVTWDAYNLRGRAVNEFTLTVPPAP
jgi:hypothetical protein